MSAADHLKNIRARHEAMEQAALVRRPSHVDRGRLLDALERVLGIKSREPLTMYEADSYTIGHSDGFNTALEQVTRTINDALEGK